MPIDPDLAAVLSCPKCHGSLLSSDDPEGFACETCKLFFAVEAGVADFLLEDARPWPLEPRSSSSRT